MAETTLHSESLTEQMIKLSMYKWEFLRRNPKYQCDYDNLQKTLSEKYDGFSAPDGSLATEEIDFCKKWRIGNALSPYRSYEDWTNNTVNSANQDGSTDLIEVKQLDFNRLMFVWMFPGFIFTRPIMPMDPECVEEDRVVKMKAAPAIVAEQGKIRVEIDLNYSKSRLLGEFKTFIDEWKKLYEESYKRQMYEDFCRKNDVLVGSKDQSPNKKFEKYYRDAVRKKSLLYEPKYHFDNFDEYLQVYDLREKIGMSWKMITTKLGLYDIQSARNFHKAACKIIEKGIEAYVNNP